MDKTIRKEEFKAKEKLLSLFLSQRNRTNFLKLLTYFFEYDIIILQKERLFYMGV
jgi:hypothetical protein